MTKVYKLVNGIAPPIMNSLFNFHANIHNSRNFHEILVENRKTVKYGKNSDVSSTVSLGESPIRT